MLPDILRRNGRHDHRTPRHGGTPAVFEPVEPLEPRMHADAMPFPGQQLSSGAALFATVGSYATLDGSSAPLTGASWDNGHELLGLNRMWADPRFAPFRGAGMRTVVLDTGINLSSSFFGSDLDHNGIADRIVYQYDFAQGDADASDASGHGSNVASALASSDATYGGVAPEAEIIALRIFNDAGQGNFLWLERGLQWVVSHAVEYNIASVNLSLGDGRFWNSPVALYNVGDELATLASMGVIVAAAAGNGYYDGGSQAGLSYPGADPHVVSVGAVYGQDDGGFAYSGGAVAFSSAAGAIAPFSQRGPTLDIFAPGAPVVGAAAAGSGLSIMHGTSQAAPQVAGLAVLAQQMATQLLGRRLTVDEFRTLLVTSGTTINDGDDEDDNVQHTGADYHLADALGMAEAIWAMRTAAAATANAAPTIESVATLAGALVNRAAVIDYNTLARAATAADPDGDVVGFVIENVAGSLTINGRAVDGGRAVLMPGDRAVWTPVTGATGEQTAFTVRATDGIDDSLGTVDVNVDIAQHADTRFARGLRLASDSPDEPAPSHDQQLENRPLPTVHGLAFLDFERASLRAGARIAAAEDLLPGPRAV